MIFQCAMVEKSDLVIFFSFFFPLTLKMRVQIHMFKGRKVQKDVDRPLFCDVFCQSKAETKYGVIEYCEGQSLAKFGSQGISWVRIISHMLSWKPMEK